MTDYKWKHIEPLSDQEKSIDLAAIHCLYYAWQTVRKDLEESHPKSLKQFMDERSRSFSIETGILEQIYTLDRGTTDTLIAKGFNEDLVPKDSTNIEPSRLIDILRDQETPIQTIMDSVAKNRHLSKHLIHELHTILTAHQETTTAMDSSGKRMEIPLRRGQYKKQPNNPQRQDGTYHEYCDPVHVDTEMENLLKWYSEYSDEDPIIVAAWLHHRFTQIHPYQDGNGRIARVLVLIVLLRSKLLPIIIDRDQRTKYIEALESADAGDLTNLCLQFAQLERNAISKAISICTDEAAKKGLLTTKSAIENLSEKLTRPKQIIDEERGKVISLAKKLRSRTRAYMKKEFATLENPFSAKTPIIHISEGGPDNNNEKKYIDDLINTDETPISYSHYLKGHFYTTARIDVGTERLTIVISFHHVGLKLTGIMEATACARIESSGNSENNQFELVGLDRCDTDPFLFTWKTKEEDIAKSYDLFWLDQSIAFALLRFGERF